MSEELEVKPEKKESRTAKYFKKKKKKSFLQNAKSFGKKGNFGRGSEVEKSDYDYLLEILKTINEGFEDDESKAIMANNVFEQSVKGKEVLFSTNQVACRVIETLLGHANGENLESLANALSSDFRVMCSDRFASFVLEKLLKIATIRSFCTNLKEEADSEDEIDDFEPAAKKQKIVKVSNDVELNLNHPITAEHQKFCNEFLLKTTKFLLNNLEDFLFDNFANHIMRTGLLCLSGLLAPSSNDPKNQEPVNLKETHHKEIPEEWKEIISDYANRLKMWPQFSELPFDETSSCILQTLCQSLRNCEEEKTLKSLMKTILGVFEDDDMEATEKPENEEEESSEFTKIFNSNSTLRLLEAMIQSSNEKQILKIYEKFFKGNLVKLSQAKNLNFSVQKLMDCIQDKSLFELVYDEVVGSLKDLLQIGHTGVVVSIVKGCQRLAAKQGQFTQALLKTLDCAGDKSNKCILPILKLKPLEIVEKEENFIVNLHGSVILQQIFQFNKPIKFVQCFLDMKPQDLSTIFSDPKGSYLADAFMQSKFIGEKSREKMIKHLEGLYLVLANSKHGSRVLDKFYEAGSEVQKEGIVSELSERVNQLNGTPSGRIINQKYQVEIYLRNKGQWKAQFTGK